MFFPGSLDQPTCIYSHWSKYVHNVSKKDLHGCLTLSAKSATAFSSVNNSSKFSCCMTEATMTSNASIILPEGDKWCPYAQCLCNYTADFKLANLEEVELVTLTGHIETLSIICTTSLVICSQKVFLSHYACYHMVGNFHWCKISQKYLETLRRNLCGFYFRITNV